MAEKAEASWIKLDSDWMDDLKIKDFRARYGRASLLDVVQLFILMQQFPDGLVDMNVEKNVKKAELIIGKKGAKLVQFLDRAAECDIIDGALWRSMGHVTSNRAARDAFRRTRQREGGRNGGRVSGESRKSKGSFKQASSKLEGSLKEA